jgi:hypothetical protein
MLTLRAPTLRAPTLGAPGVALVLALAASVSLAQTGEADPPAANTVPGLGETRTKPKPVLTLEQKRQLVAFCGLEANSSDPSCKGLTTATTSTEVLGGVPES